MGKREFSSFFFLSFFLVLALKLGLLSWFCIVLCSSIDLMMKKIVNFARIFFVFNSIGFFFYGMVCMWYELGWLLHHHELQVASARKRLLQFTVMMIL